MPRRSTKVKLRVRSRSKSKPAVNRAPPRKPAPSQVKVRVVKQAPKPVVTNMTKPAPKPAVKEVKAAVEAVVEKVEKVEEVEVEAVEAVEEKVDVIITPRCLEPVADHHTFLVTLGDLCGQNVVVVGAAHENLVQALEANGHVASVHLLQDLHSDTNLRPHSVLVALKGSGVDEDWIAETAKNWDQVLHESNVDAASEKLKALHNEVHLLHSAADSYVRLYK